MIEKDKYFNEILYQSAIDYVCDIKDLIGDDIVIKSAPEIYKTGISGGTDTFFKMITFGKGAVITADETVCTSLSEFATDKCGSYLFNIDNLYEIDGIIREYGYKLNKILFHYIPTKETTVKNIPYIIKRFEKEEISQFYGKGFHNALSDHYNSEKPDVLVFCAYDKGRIIGMAGASRDTELIWQIGIDVLTDYRSCGVGSYLVNALKNEIISCGKIPFYTSAATNIHSQNIAINAGFSPIYADIYSKKMF